MQPLATLLAPELQEARKRRRNWLAVVVVLVVGVCVLLLEWRPFYAWMQGMRSRRMAAKAEAELFAGNIDEALKKARIAYWTMPDEPAAIRVAAKAQRMIGQYAAAVPLWKQLRLTGAMRIEDRRPYAEDLLMSGAVAEAGKEIEALLKDNISESALFRLAARWSAVEGNSEKAREFAAKAVKMEPESHEGRLLLALLQLSAGTATLREEATRSMLALGAENSREGIEALRQLGTLRGISREVAGQVSQLLQRHALATEQHRILAFNLDLDLHPAERAAMLDAAVEKYSKAAPAVRCEFGNWLNGHGEFGRMEKLIPLEEAFKRQDMLLVVLNSLASLRRWTEIERILQTKDVPLYTAMKELFLARVAEETGSKAAADLHWTRAHIAAAASPEHLREIAAYAEKMGRPAQAEQAYRSLAANANTARPAMEGLLKIAGSRGDMDMLRDTLKKMRERWPQDDSVKNDLAYFNLLAGKSVDESCAAARDLVARSPGSLPHLTTLALAMLRKKDPAAALSVYQGLRIPWERIAPPQRAVHAAVLGANGRTAEAVAEIAALRWDDLRPEEQELIKQWRKQ